MRVMAGNVPYNVRKVSVTKKVYKLKHYPPLPALPAKLLDRLPVRRLAFALARLPAIAFQVLLDAGAVVASRPVSPIERTKTRPNCPTSCTP
jgi:hypothetical protein